MQISLRRNALKLGIGLIASLLLIGGLRLSLRGIIFLPRIARACGLGQTATMLANTDPALANPQLPQSPPDNPLGVFARDYLVGQSITFTEDLSRLPTPINVNALQWNWDFGDGQQAKGYSVKHTYSHTGSFAVRVGIVDPQNSQNDEPELDSAQITVIDRAYDKPPIAKATGSANYVQIGKSVSYDATGSASQIGGDLQYTWNFGDGTTDNGVQATHLFSNPGVGNVTLIVQDKRGAKGIANVPIAVVIGFPTAALSASATQVHTGDTVTFDASQSAPISPDLQAGDRLVKYQWDFGDGETATSPGPVALHSYSKGGTFTATVAAIDTFGVPGTASVIIHVQGQASGGSNSGMLLIIIGLIVLLAVVVGSVWLRTKLQRTNTALARARSAPGKPIQRRLPQGAKKK